MRTSKCKHCGIDVVSGRRGTVADFCSKSCQEKFRRNGRRVAKACEHCGKPMGKVHGRRRFCSSTCKAMHHFRRDQAIRKLAYYASGYQNRKCIVCGASFIVDFGMHDFTRKTCSPACMKANRKKNARIFDAIYGARRRAIVRASGERIDPVEVIVRAGCRCQICGRETPLALRGKHLPASPEIDHIIPLTRGGLHVMANVQCACRACNGRKSNHLTIAA